MKLKKISVKNDTMINNNAAHVTILAGFRWCARRRCLNLAAWRLVGPMYFFACAYYKPTSKKVQYTEARDSFLLVNDDFAATNRPKPAQIGIKFRIVLALAVRTVYRTFVYIYYYCMYNNDATMQPPARDATTTTYIYA